MIKTLLSNYIIYYQPYILIYWTIFLLIYFSARYKLYKTKIFYFLLFLFIFGFLLFKDIFPDNLVLIEKQRIRYISLAKNFVEKGIFAHIVDGRVIFDRHLAYCSIPISFGIFLFGTENVFKFIYWYNLFSLIVMIYLGYKIFRDTKKLKYYPFVLLFLSYFLYHEALDPYNYPEFSNMLIFSIFLYLLFFKRDERALLILPILFSSGNEYIFFFVFTPAILYLIKKDNLLGRSLFYYFVYFLVAFSYIFLTFLDHIIGDIDLFFKKEMYYNTINVIKFRFHIYYPFVSILFLSLFDIFMKIKERNKEEFLNIFSSLFYLSFFVIISGWGVTPNDYLYEHFLPNLLPVIILILNKYNKISIILSIPVLYFLVFNYTMPKFYAQASIDNLVYLKDILEYIPKNGTIIFPRINEYNYFMLLGIKIDNVYTFDNLNYNILSDKYYLVTTSFMENNNNFNFDKVHKAFYRVCKLLHENPQWKIYICQGYDDNLISVLEMFKKQRFG